MEPFETDFLIDCTDTKIYVDSLHTCIYIQSVDPGDPLFMLFLAMDIMAKPQSGKDVEDTHWQGQTTTGAGRVHVRSICLGIYTNYLARYR